MSDTKEATLAVTVIYWQAKAAFHNTNVASPDSNVTSHDTNGASHDTNVASYDTNVASLEMTAASYDTNGASRDPNGTSLDRTAIAAGARRASWPDYASVGHSPDVLGDTLAGTYQQFAGSANQSRDHRAKTSAATHQEWLMMAR